MSFSRKTCLGFMGVFVASYCLSVSLGKDISRSKRSPDSLYDNIYSAISEFSGTNNNQDVEQLASVNLDDLPEQVRTSRNAQGFNAVQLPRGGRQSPRQVIVDGFPAGLPEGTPEGVKIALASALPPEDMPPIPGVAGVDYPTYSSVPDTGFDCNSQQFLPGIYGDTGADCQVFYMCQLDGNFNGFLCPNGTMFNQQYFICDWWYNVDCAATPNFYGLNEFLYQDQPNGGSSGNNGFAFSGDSNGINGGSGSLGNGNNGGISIRGRGNGNGNGLSTYGNSVSASNSYGIPQANPVG